MGSIAKFSTISSLARRLEGKVALITGGATGIGECTAKLFAANGAKVAIADVRDDLGRSVAEQLGPSTAKYIHCDVTNEEHVRAAVDATVSSYGKLDIMFNNAGVADPPKPRIGDMEKADFERVLAVNVTGVFLGMKHAARVMIPARRGGAIISTASIVSGMGGGATHAYTCSKVAVELGQFGIRVNCLWPFGVATDLATKYMGVEGGAFEEAITSMSNLKGTTLKASDVANAALFLASDEAKYVSGQNLFVDGGTSIPTLSIKLFNYPPF